MSTNAVAQAAIRAGLTEAMGKLIADLGHYADNCGLDYLEMVKDGLGMWSAERHTKPPKGNEPSDLRAIARLLVKAVDAAADAGGTDASYCDPAVVLIVKKIESLVHSSDRFSDASQCRRRESS